eukprot:2077203-Pyramimonas_sp.AAC.1
MTATIIILLGSELEGDMPWVTSMRDMKNLSVEFVDERACDVDSLALLGIVSPLGKRIRYGLAFAVLWGVPYTKGSS